MGYLLDTHILLWSLDESEKLPLTAKNIIEDIDNECFVSIVSLYEIAIKKNIGKLNTKNSISVLVTELNKIGISILPIKPKHLETYVSLTQVNEHKDPFDRLIIATASTESLALITVDEKFKHYEDLITIV